MKRRMGYLMHAPWGWARQRMHYLAEEMCRSFAVEVLDGLLFNVDRNLANTPSESSLHVRRLSKIRGERLLPIRSLNAVWRHYQLSRVVKRCEYVWLTHPTLFSEIESALTPRHILIYDCMDDVLEFPGLSAERRAQIQRDEQKLVLRANWILCSSDELRLRMVSRYAEKIMASCRVVNNGISFADDDLHRELDYSLQQVFKRHRSAATYIGTVSAWLDRDLISRSLERFPELVYLFVGPSDVGLPKHKRLYYHPPVEHADVFPVMNRSALLVMPFRLNALVKAVNPVKLYEYIYSGKPIIARRYAEMECFREYAYLYDSEEEYLDLLGSFVKDQLPSKSDLTKCRQFACQNTWFMRGQQILDIIEQRDKCC